MKNRSLLAAILLALSIGPASAETTSPSGEGRFIAQSKIGRWKASKLLGIKIYNDNNENIGSISELILDDSGKIESVVVSFGGFLGVGKRDVAVPFSEIKAPSADKTKEKQETQKHQQNDKTTTSNDDKKLAPNEPGTPPFAILTMSIDELKAAPELKYVQ